MEKSINIKLRVWRQAGPKAKGGFETYELKGLKNSKIYGTQFGTFQFTRCRE